MFAVCQHPLWSTETCVHGLGPIQRKFWGSAWFHTTTSFPTTTEPIRFNTDLGLSLNQLQFGMWRTLKKKSLKSQMWIDFVSVCYLRGAPECTMSVDRSRQKFTGRQNSSFRDEKGVRFDPKMSGILLYSNFWFPASRNTLVCGDSTWRGRHQHWQGSDSQQGLQYWKHSAVRSCSDLVLTWVLADRITGRQFCDRISICK